MGEITFAPDLPQPQCGKVFRRIPILRLLLPGFLVQHPLHHPTVLGAAYALLPTGTVAAVFLCSQVSFLLSFLVVAGVCQYFSLWTDIDIFFRIIGECFRLEAFRVGRRVVWLQPLGESNQCSHPGYPKENRRSGRMAQRGKVRTVQTEIPGFDFPAASLF